MNNNSSNHNKELGNSGEELAVSFIENKGYIVLEKNFHFGTLGEIDIIARDGEELVFIEVKTRTNHYFGDPIMSITKKKQMFLRKAAEGYMFTRQLLNTPCRLDFIAIDMLDKGNPVITHLENAF